MRFVVCSPGAEGDPWLLPASVPGPDARICGGVRSLHELAVAIACTGRTVELRGHVAAPVLDALARAAGAAPHVALPARRPTADDVVIAPEGWTAPQQYARLALSPARRVLLLLAPPGLFGWPFVAGWTRPDPLTVDPATLARPEHFAEAAGLGFVLWTNAAGIAAAAAAGGTACTWVGAGWPVVPAAPGGPRTLGAVALAENRWAPLARRVLAALGPDAATEIPAGDHDTVLATLARSRVLVWPSRVEGWARIQCEARALGVVPVALASNPYAAGLDAAGGAVVVDALAAMAPAVRTLLADETAWRATSARAVAAAHALVDWDAYVRRVDAALADVAARPAPPAAPGVLGDGIAADRAVLVAERDAAREAAAVQAAAHAEAAAVAARLTADLHAAEAHAARLVHRLAAVRSTAFDDAWFARRARPLLTTRPARWAVALRTRLRDRPAPRVLVIPGRLDDPGYTIAQALACLGAQVDTAPAPGVQYALVLGWLDSNHVRTPGMTARPAAVGRALADAVMHVPARRYWNCSPALDVAKRAVAEAFALAFGRALAVDPARHAGPAVEKSDENATHDGRLVDCPVTPRPGRVYQRWIASGTVPPRQWRITLLGGRATLAVERTIDAARPFAPGARAAALVPLDTVLDADERARIEAFAGLMHVEYAELDLLRDADGAAWIVDVNPTPTLTAVGVPDAAARARIVAAQAEALAALLR